MFKTGLEYPSSTHTYKKIKGETTGGSLAHATAVIVDTVRSTTMHRISAKPDEVVLFDTLLDAAGSWEDLFRTNWSALSQSLNLDNPLPPAMAFRRGADKIAPYLIVHRFMGRASELGSIQIEFIDFVRRGYGIFRGSNGISDDFAATLDRAAAFFKTTGWDVEQNASFNGTSEAVCGNGLCQRGESHQVCPADCRQIVSHSNKAELIVDRSLAPRGIEQSNGDLLLGVKRTISGKNVIQAIAGKLAQGKWAISGIVEENTSRDLGGLGNPSPFVDKSDRLLMAFRDHADVEGGTAYKLRVEFSDDRGLTWHRWDSGEGGVIDRSDHGLWEPFIYRDARGDLRVVYAKERVPRLCNGRPVEKQDVVMKVSLDGGKSWGGEQVVASAGVSREGVPTVARLRDGSYVLVFESWRNEECETLNPKLVIRYMQSKDGVNWGNRRLLYSPDSLAESARPGVQDYPVASWPYAIRLQDGRLLVLFTTNEDHSGPDGKFESRKKAFDIKFMLTKHEASYENIEWEEMPPHIAYARSTSNDDVRFPSAVELNNGDLVVLFARPARYKTFELR
jgi:hypothetical protein